MQKRYRNICFTINNPTCEDVERIEKVKDTFFDYIVMGSEVGDKGTFHIQGYAELAKQTSFSIIKDVMPTAHIEVRKGTSLQASEYCKKDGQYVEYGILSQQGKRSDIDSVKGKIFSGVPIKEIIMQCTNNAQIRFVENMVKYTSKVRDTRPIVIWLYGKSGVGKSNIANIITGFMGTQYFLSNSKWFDGYDQQECVVLDELRPQDHPYSYLLRLLDKYPFRVETKGSSVNFNSDLIIITSCYPPIAFSGCEDSRQLLRRINWLVNLIIPEY